MDLDVDTLKYRQAKGTRAATIVAVLGDEIHHGVIPPGTKLVEEVLAERFKVSRGPVRDAIRLLERDGLVEVRPHLGAVVPKLTLQGLLDLYEIRIALFSVAVRRFGQRWKADALDDDAKSRFRVLANLITDAQDAPAREFAELTQTFSGFMLEHCGNTKLRDEMYRLNRQSYLYYVELGHQNREHRRVFLSLGAMLVEAVEMSEPELAGDLAARLVAANQTAVCEEFIRRHPGGEEG